MISIARREAITRMGMYAGTALLSGCAVNPVTGKREFMLMSEAQEIEMGNEAHGQIVAEYGSYVDSSMQDWFNEKGQEMAAITHRKHLTHHFTVLDSPVINAFAVPGGFVYVTRGILGYFNDEAQFAGVLAHELGHVNARHTAARYSKAKLANFGLAVGSIFSEEFAKYSQFVSLGTTLLFLKFSRNDERQADKLGVEYSSAVSYDAVHMSDFFKTLERLRPEGGSLPSWQSTHPDPGDRINATRKMALAYQNNHPDMTFVAKKEEYLERINGLVFGEDPRQGYVKDAVFYHPGMKFQFPVPQGWDITNQPTEVRLSPQKQDALLIFTLAPGTDPRDAIQKFAGSNNIIYADTRTISVNEMSGIHSTGKIESQDNVVGITSYFIMMDDKVYAFHGLAEPSRIGLFDGDFSHSARGFDRLTDTSLIEVSPKKIVVRKTQKKTTLKDTLNDAGVPEEELDKLAVINGLELTDILDTGTSIKTIT